MAEQTTIEWCDSTWNPLRGTKGNWFCVHASTGCLNCYAERLNVRFGGPRYRVGADTVRLDEAALKLPLRWKRPRRVFVCSMTDLFGEWVPEEYIIRVFMVMRGAWALDGSVLPPEERPRHTYIVLTKRAERMRRFMEERYPEGFGLPNLWLGVSVENQATADERIPHLLATPAAVRFLSCEPLLSELDLRPYLWEDPGPVWSGNNPADPTVDWIIVGAESGPGARRMSVTWVRDLRDQVLGLPDECRPKLFVKQFAERGHKLPLPELDGRRWAEWPA